MWWYDTWKDVHQRTYFAPGPKKRPLPTGTRATEYILAARGVLLEALRARRPGAKQALHWLHQQVPDIAKRFADNPTWALKVPED